MNKTVISLVLTTLFLQGCHKNPDPGTKFSYNSLQSLLLSAIITKTGGMTARKFAEEYLTEPMGIEIFRWESDPQGNTIGSYNLFMTPREMAVLTEYNYGYHWWIGKMQGYDLFIAWDMGGQFIICAPDQDLIVVVTCNPDISVPSGFKDEVAPGATSSV